MTTKDSIQKLSATLKHGDMKAIAIASGLTPATISRYFKGEEGLISDANEAKIIEAARQVIENRLNLKKKNQRTIDKIINEA